MGSIKSHSGNRSTIATTSKEGKDGIQIGKNEYTIANQSIKKDIREGQRLPKTTLHK